MTVDRETVQFDQGGDCWVDVAEFTDLTHGADLTGLLDPSGLEKAIALYRGPFLEGFSLRDSPAFEQWALVMRERLQRQALEALGRLSGHYEGQGEWGRAIEVARRQLELEPWDEAAHQATMRLLARSGRRAEALAQYEACVRALKDELDVEPARRPGGCMSASAMKRSEQPPWKPERRGRPRKPGLWRCLCATSPLR